MKDEKSLFYAGMLKAEHKTNLQLFQDIFAENILYSRSRAFDELEIRKLGYFVSRNFNMEQVYEKCKIEQIDLLYIRGDIQNIVDNKIGI